MDTPDLARYIVDLHNSQLEKKICGVKSSDGLYVCGFTFAHAGLHDFDFDWVRK